MSMVARSLEVLHSLVVVVLIGVSVNSYMVGDVVDVVTKSRSVGIAFM